MTITGLLGDIGSGKTHKSVHYMIEQANFKRKNLVTNYKLNIPELIEYCRRKKYGWVAHLAQTGQIAIVDTLKHLTDLLKYPSSIVCMDEAGVFLNSREFSKTPKELLTDLCQSRKDGVDLIWIAQFEKQVDLQFRNLTQYYIHCEGYTTYCKQLKRPRLHWKTYYTFKASNYNRWIESPARNSFLKTWVKHTLSTDFGPLTESDKQLFKVFSSFDRLDKQDGNTKKFDKREPCHPLQALRNHQLAGLLARCNWWQKYQYRQKLTKYGPKRAYRYLQTCLPELARAPWQQFAVQKEEVTQEPVNEPVKTPEKKLGELAKVLPNF